jgi:hypothetical protein
MASNFFTANVTPVSVTTNEHAACRDEASVALQFTVVAPSGNEAPDAWVQVVVTGAVPAVTVGAG